MSEAQLAEIKKFLPAVELTEIRNACGKLLCVVFETNLAVLNRQLAVVIYVASSETGVWRGFVQEVEWIYPLTHIYDASTASELQRRLIDDTVSYVIEKIQPHLKFARRG